MELSLATESDKLFEKLVDFLQSEKLEMTLPVFSFLRLTAESQPDVLSMCFWLTQTKPDVC